MVTVPVSPVPSLEQGWVLFAYVADCGLRAVLRRLSAPYLIFLSFVLLISFRCEDFLFSELQKCSLTSPGCSLSIHCVCLRDKAAVVAEIEAFSAVQTSS